MSRSVPQEMPSGISASPPMIRKPGTTSRAVTGQPANEGSPAWMVQPAARCAWVQAAKPSDRRWVKSSR